MFSRPVRIYADMVADLFHCGHVALIRKAKFLVPHETHLIIGIHSDEVCESYKRKPIYTMDERVGLVGTCRYVDEVIPNAPLKITEEFLIDNEINLVVHGNDMDEFMNDCYKLPISKGIMRFVPYEQGVSTTQIINRVIELSQKEDYAEKRYKKI